MICDLCFLIHVFACKIPAFSNLIKMRNGQENFEFVLGFLHLRKTSQV